MLGAKKIQRNHPNDITDCCHEMKEMEINRLNNSLGVVASSVGANIITSVAPATTVASGSTLNNVDNNEERELIKKELIKESWKRRNGKKTKQLHGRNEGNSVW
ncbi:uncharacterized protein LOC136075111 [Hydra vulgaris]|uniref:Uncharacterized protein LOC136075111 n=1 Tax=Hydra vulgaris TaxID=6087 RepID=A0ABM4B3T5_HYDVU